MLREEHRVILLPESGTSVAAGADRNREGKVMAKGNHWSAYRAHDAHDDEPIKIAAAFDEIDRAMPRQKALRTLRLVCAFAFRDGAHPDQSRVPLLIDAKMALDTTGEA